MFKASIAFKPGSYVRACLSLVKWAPRSERLIMSAAYRVAAEVALSAFKGAITVDVHEGFVTLEFVEGASEAAEEAAINMLRDAIDACRTIAINRVNKIDKTIR
jgi:hypothetical protein